jgi:hypothetical protein
MAHHSSALLTDIVTNDSGVTQSYRHISKWVIPGEPIEIKGALLKWYELAPRDEPVPANISHLARTHLSRTTLEARGLGFIILHRCGEAFYFLIVNTWRGNNELWETVFYKESEAMSDFAPFPRDGMHKPTFCVWELAPVWHEKQAWEQFLKSARGETAAQDWLRDQYAGIA